MKKLICLLNIILVYLFFSTAYVKAYEIDDSILREPLKENLNNVYTDNGTQVNAYRYLYDMSEEQRYYNNSLYSGYTILFDSSWFYNCYAFAFHYKGDMSMMPVFLDNAVWIADANVYINDHSYEEISISNIRVGDVVGYYNNGNLSHVGVITTNSGVLNLFNQTQINVHSKMGSGPLIQHTLFDAREYYTIGTTSVKYYTNYRHLVSSNESLNRYFHEGYCSHCDSIIQERHVLMQGFSNYWCKYCDYTTPFIPIIQSTGTYYLFASDQTNTLRTYSELQLYLIKNNYLSYLSDLRNLEYEEK